MRDRAVRSTGRIDWSIPLREIQASEAKTHLPQLLDEVEHGETIVITRHGRPIARLVPETACRQAEIDQALAEIKEIQRRTRRVAVKDILSSIHEGHKY
jgi:prevent-host-death family protein